MSDLLERYRQEQAARRAEVQALSPGLRRDLQRLCVIASHPDTAGGITESRGREILGCTLDEFRALIHALDPDAPDPAPSLEPPMTDPTHATDAFGLTLPVLKLTTAEMTLMPAYNYTVPTGLRPGRRWRRHHMPRPGERVWYVGEYVPHPQAPDGVAITWYLASVDGGAPGEWATDPRLALSAADLAALDGHTPGPWSDEDSPEFWQLFAHASAPLPEGAPEDVHAMFPDGLPQHPRQLIKAPKRGTPYQEYWPDPADARLIRAAPDVLRAARIHAARADMAEARAMTLEEIGWAVYEAYEQADDVPAPLGQAVRELLRVLRYEALDPGPAGPAGTARPEGPA